MAIGSSFRGLFRLLGYGGWTALSIPVQAAILRFGLPGRRWFPRFYHGVCLRLLGIEVQVLGTPSAVRPTLFVSNHASYLDIPVLGSLLETSFVAKREVGTWPVFGLLARLQETVFVERQARHKAHEQRDSMAGRLRAGDNLVLFPEGTSSDGNRTLPFKTALFSVAATRVPQPGGGEAALTVQPVSVTATHLDDIPLGHVLRPLYAWYGDMDLPPHLWQFARAGRLRVVVEFHPALTVEQVSSRKALADHCWRAVAGGVDRAVAGRLPPVPGPGAPLIELPVPQPG
ncbi:lysophospholipid acyltransferase family protein [Rhodocista pekingensis]|uniref:Lysophospholipid acyltransferase family protein n=1 Tax=Rhodocista pekingensis TaxID=201185 RepID=A0ABW2KXI6_9PROT